MIVYRLDVGLPLPSVRRWTVIAPTSANLAMEVRTVRSLNLLCPAMVPTEGKHSPVELLAHWQRTQSVSRSAALSGASSANHWAGTNEKRGAMTYTRKARVVLGKILAHPKAGTRHQNRRGPKRKFAAHALERKQP